MSKEGSKPIIVLAGLKGGVGRSTLAKELAIIYGATEGSSSGAMRVCLIDASSGSQSALFGIANPKYSLNDLLSKYRSDIRTTSYRTIQESYTWEYIQQFFVRDVSRGIYLLPAPENEPETPMSTGEAIVLFRILFNFFDVLIVDTSNALVEPDCPAGTQAAIILATHIFYVINDDEMNIVSLKKMKQFLVKKKLLSTRKDCFHIVFNGYRTSRNDQFYSASMVEEYSGFHVISTIPYYEDYWILNNTFRSATETDNPVRLPLYRLAQVAVPELEIPELHNEKGKIMKKIKKLFGLTVMTAAMLFSSFSFNRSITSYAATYSDAWYQTSEGEWHVKDSRGSMVKEAWLCDDAVPENGKDIWYLIDNSGNMMNAGLVIDETGNYYSLETEHNGYYGMLRYKSGVYDGIYLELESSHNGSFAAIKNEDGINALRQKYGVTSVAIGNSNIVYTSSFGTASASSSAQQSVSAPKNASGSSSEATEDAFAGVRAEVYEHNVASNAIFPAEAMERTLALLSANPGYSNSEYAMLDTGVTFAPSNSKASVRSTKYNLLFPSWGVKFYADSKHTKSTIKKNTDGSLYFDLYGTVPNTPTIKVGFIPGTDYAETLSQIRTSLTTAKAVAQGATGSKRDKIEYIYNWIVNNCEYLDDGTDYCHSSASVFEKRYGVCDSFSYAFCLIASYADIECCYVISNNGTHTRVVVSLDGTYYWIDLANKYFLRPLSQRWVTYMQNPNGYYIPETFD